MAVVNVVTVTIITIVMFFYPIIKAGISPALLTLMLFGYLEPRFLSAISIAFFTILPQSLEDTEPHPSLSTVFETPSSLAISYFNWSDIRLLRLLTVHSSFAGLKARNFSAYLLIMSLYRD